MLGSCLKRKLILANILQRAIAWDYDVVGGYLRGLHDANPSAGITLCPADVSIQFKRELFIDICISEALFMYHESMISMNITRFSISGSRFYANTSI